MFLSAVFVCCGRADERQVRDSDEVTAVSDWTESANQWADSVMKRMSLEEMVGQLFMPASYAATDYWTIRQLVRYVADSNVGGVLFLQGDTCRKESCPTRFARFRKCRCLWLWMLSGGLVCVSKMHRLIR